MNRALFWGIAFLLSRLFPATPEEVELAFIGTALGIGLAAASIGGSVASGLLAKAGAGKQARAAERSSAAAIAEQRRQFDITQGNLAPFLGAGKRRESRKAIPQNNALFMLYLVREGSKQNHVT